MQASQGSNNIINVTTQNAREVLLDQAQDKVVLIDFWADWCEPCKQLTPVLEKIAQEYANSLILAKIDVEAEQQLAAQFGVQSLPTIVVFKDGQPVDGLAGAQPESAIRQMLEKHLPQPEDDALSAAREALAQEQYDEAYTQAKQAFDLNPSATEARLLLADAATSVGRVEQAEELLQNLSIADQDQYYQQILAKIQLTKEAADSPAIKALEEQVAQSPEDLAARVQLAVQYHQAKRHEDALEQLFTVLAKDLQFGEARQTTVDIINNLPDGDPLAAQSRRRLYSMLY